MKIVSQLRSSEWMILGYFGYAALIAPFFIPTWKALLFTSLVAGSIWAISRMPPIVRDWAPLAWTYAAYRQMDWFTPVVRDRHLENTWIVWDRWLLDGLHLRAVIESGGILPPAYFELSYALVYAVAPVSIAALYCYSPNGFGRRVLVNQFWLVYLAGTLGSYALFPYFLSEPPRTVFLGADLPHTVTAIRSFNLWIAQNYGIHSSVFPSAHVSAACAAAWGLLATLPERKRLGLWMAVYSMSVAIAAVYGRYHYLADVLAGLAMSVLGFAAVYISNDAVSLLHGQDKRVWRLHSTD
jgi:membrane-associated phospholipid phosphatase